MKKKVYGRQFKRDTNERKALFKGLLSSLVLKERIQTTQEKAKAIKGQAEKLVTRVKKNRQPFSIFQKYLTPPAVQKLALDIAPRFTDRNGGYTRIMRLGRRLKDNASMVFIEWVEKSIKKETPSPEKKEKTK